MERIKFQDGEQTDFLKSVKKNLDVKTWKKLAEILEVNRRTLIDWKNEEYTLPKKVFQKCMNLAGEDINIPSEIEKKSRFWYTSKGGSSKGGKAVYKKYGQVGGDPEYRKKKWREWWEKEGKFKNNLPNSRKEINKPDQGKKLAEFIGIVLGDGGITDNQVAISFHKENHKDYASWVQELVESLFQIEAPIYNYSEDKKVITVTISSKNLVEFLLTRGLKKGNKVEQQVEVPEWIENDINFSKNCLRGLIDTDGGIYFHKHKSHGQELFNIGLSFTNRSEPLLDFTEKLLKEFGFTPKRSSREDDIFLYRQQEVFDYNREIGFHNNYHTGRIEKFKNKKGK